MGQSLGDTGPALPEGVRRRYALIWQAIAPRRGLRVQTDRAARSAAQVAGTVPAAIRISSSEPSSTRYTTNTVSVWLVSQRNSQAMEA